jgi:hypothetical protein
MALYFDEFIQSVYEEIGEQAGYSQEYLANWFAGNINLGKLNNLIDTCFSGTYSTGIYGEVLSYDIEPDLGQQEMAIYKKIFEIDYYNKTARTVLNGAAGILAGQDWITLKEGDSSITRSNRNEVARTYKTMSKDATEELNRMVNSYLKFKSLPQQVVGDDAVSAGYYIGGSSKYKGFRGNKDNFL